MTTEKANKGWRHEKMRAQKLVLCERRITIDADGFIVETLEPSEVEKVGRTPKWSFCDRMGPDIVATKRADCERIAEDLRKKLANARVVVADLEKKLADAEQRALVLGQEEAAALLRAKESLAESKKIDLVKASFDDLRSYAAQHGIVTAGQTRDAIVAAISAVLAQTALSDEKNDPPPVYEGRRKPSRSAT